MATRQGTWDLNPAAEAVTGYELSLDDTVVGVVGPTVNTFTFQNIPNGDRTFAVVALNSANPPGEDRSDPAIVTQKITGKPSKPMNFVIG